MNIAEAKELVLAACTREKRIAVRNLIFIANLVIGIVAVVHQYALPQLQAYITAVQTEVTNKPYQQYYKWVLGFGVSLTILYPALGLYKVLARAKNALQAFDKIEAREDCRILGEKTKFLTILPLIWLKLKLDPVHYLMVQVGTKAYDLPIPESLSPQIIMALSGADIEKIKNVLQQLYSESSRPENVAAAAPLPSPEAFSSFATAALAEDLKYIEGSRKTNKNMFVIQIISAFAFVGTIFYVSMINPTILSNSKSIFTLIGVVVGVSVLLSVVFTIFLKMKNRGSNQFSDFSDFKRSVFSRVVRFANLNFEYIDKGHIGKPELLHSGLVVDTNYRITGGDQITGIHNGVPFQSCNLYVSHRPQLRNKKEPDNEVFAGNYFVARFNKTFQYPIYIHPKKGVFGIMKDNDIAEYLDGSRRKITLEDPEFDKQFTVYCEDEIIVRYVLTPAMMERIKAINTRSKGNLYIAINGKNIVLANNTSNSLMNMDGLTSVLFTKLDQKLLQQLYEGLYADLAMIDTLKLNINIWR